MKEIKEVSVRWSDGYLEEFEVSEVRAGCDLLWMVLVNGQNRHIPLRTVRWFSINPKSYPKSLGKCDSKGNLEPYSNSAKPSDGNENSAKPSDGNESGLCIIIDKFVNNRTQDIKEFAEELDSFRRQSKNGTTQE